jgi:hypothetical protein
MPHIKYNSFPISPTWPWVKPSQYGRLKNISAGHTRKLCREGKIPGATQFIRYWMIPNPIYKPKEKDDKA